MRAKIEVCRGGARHQGCALLIAVLAAEAACGQARLPAPVQPPGAAPAMSAAPDDQSMFTPFVGDGVSYPSTAWPGTSGNSSPAAPPCRVAFQPPALTNPTTDGSQDGLDDDTQDMPGADLNLFEEDDDGEDDVDLPPDYFYEEYYYNTYGVGARAIADYAPPGYEARDYQDAPGVPEFRRITPPPRPTARAADDVEHFVTRGMYPGSFLVPGINTSFRLRGFVRLAALYDFDPIGSSDSFVPNTIPVPQEEGQNFNMSGRISRFALESWTPTNFCDWNVHTLIEGDFFNGPAQAAGGGGNPFRLRHAFFDFGYFRFGQQNSVFMDGTNWASLVDFQGPNSWTNQRQPSARMTLPIATRWYWATSVERPFSDITTNGLGTNVQDVPDFATHLRYETDVGHLQAATVLRNIGYRANGDDDVSRETGVGLSGNAVFHPWAILMGTDPVREENPSGLTRSRILLQTTWGPGVGRYVNDLAGQGFDGQVDPITGEFDLVDATGWNASYEHWFNAYWLSNFTYSQVEVDNNDDQPATTYNRGKYLAASLWWIPIPRMSLGIEYITGERENLDGQEADADRLHGLFQYNF
jgi:hypothetical protein